MRMIFAYNSRHHERWWMVRWKCSAELGQTWAPGVQKYQVQTISGTQPGKYWVRHGGLARLHPLGICVRIIPWPCVCCISGVLEQWRRHRQPFLHPTDLAYRTTHDSAESARMLTAAAEGLLMWRYTMPCQIPRIWMVLPCSSNRVRLAEYHYLMIWAFGRCNLLVWSSKAPFQSQHRFGMKRRSLGRAAYFSEISDDSCQLCCVGSYWSLQFAK